MKILKIIAKNFIEFIIVSWIVLTIVFFLINSIPGQSQATVGLSEAARKNIEQDYGLNKPIFIRYLIYIKNLIQGDLGKSFVLRPNVEINHFLWNRFGTSFVVGSLSLLITLVLGIPLGILIGKTKNRFFDSMSTLLISIIISIPGIIFALILLIFGKSLGIPYIYESNNFITWILPSIALGVQPSIVYIKYIKTEMYTELNSMHAKFAYLKGVKKRRFVVRHALKPSMFPIVTFLPMAFLATFIGGIFVEKIFQIPGSGGLLIEAIQSKDFNIILTIVTIYSAMTVLSYNIRDVLYTIIDPRTRR